MPMYQKISEKRRALGLTQEQVANALGVTTPAVNKWEKGATCPDLTLLPALARLLKTDPNTLLCFEESLTRQEVVRFLNEAAEKNQKEGYVAGFTWLIAKTQEYPNCAELQHSAALLLDGALKIAALPEEETAKYDAEIEKLYERAAQGDGPDVASRARYMLSSRLLCKGDCDGAQAILDALPEQKTLDKRILQAQILEKQGKPGEAAALLERKVLQSVQENLTVLAVLVQYEVEAGDAETAQRLAAASQTECEAFGLWSYGAFLAPTQAAVARKDAPTALSLLRKTLAAILVPWDVGASPLCTRFPHKESDAQLGQRMLAALLNDLEANSDFDFLRSEPEFAALLKEYRAKCILKEA
jgi:transcriptional regulator with XRE-family HTH domain